MVYYIGLVYKDYCLLIAKFGVDISVTRVGSIIVDLAKFQHVDHLRDFLREISTRKQQHQSQVFEKEDPLENVYYLGIAWLIIQKMPRMVIMMPYP